MVQTVRVFPVGKTIQVGGKSDAELLAMLVEAGIEASPWAKFVMGKIAFKANEPREMRLARAKVRALGFAEKPTTRQLKERIHELEHKLCPPDAAPHIALTYADELKKGEGFWVAMEQIKGPADEPLIFYIVWFENGVRTLCCSQANDDGVWDLDVEFVFVLGT